MNYEPDPYRHLAVEEKKPRTRRIPRKALANVLDWADRGVSWQLDQDNRYRDDEADKADIAKVRAFFNIPDPETQKPKKRPRSR